MRSRIYTLLRQFHYLRDRSVSRETYSRSLLAAIKEVCQFTNIEGSLCAFLIHAGNRATKSDVSRLVAGPTHTRSVFLLTLLPGHAPAQVSSAASQHRGVVAVLA